MKQIMALLILPAFIVTTCSAVASEDKNNSSRLTPYEPSYFVLQQASGDETAIRAHYSFKYCLSKYNHVANEHGGNSCRSTDHKANELYISYTGEFDFYMRTRPSDPVINRLSNPALHYQWKLDSIEWLDFAVEHRSNGQATEISTPLQAAKAQIAYDSNDHVFFDSISRGSNFLSVESKIKSGNEKTSFYAKLKQYFSRDSDITWGPLAATNTAISDYDRLRILVRNDIGDYGEFSVEWTVGDRGLSTDSWNIDYLYSKDLPLTVYFRYHNGPMHTLSNYTDNQNYLGAGLKLTP